MLCQSPWFYPPLPLAYIVPGTLQGPFSPWYWLLSVEIAVVDKVMPYLLEKVNVRELA